MSSAVVRDAYTRFNMFEWIVDIVRQSEYLGIFLLMLVENLFPPIPSELIMPMGGFLADQGELNLTGVIVAGTAGSYVGQVALYFLGRKVGEKRFEAWVEAHGHWLAISPEEVKRAHRWLHRRRGGVAVFLGRLLPGIRSLISLPAGMTKMPLALFLPWTLAGTALWTGLLTGGGLLLGQNYDKVEKALDPLSWLVLGGIVVSYVWRVARRSSGGPNPRSAGA